MGSLFKPKAPKPVDTVALTQAQADANLDAARFNAAINRPDQIAPGGTLTNTLRPGADLANPLPGDFIQTTTLDPAQQALFDTDTRISQNFLNTAESALGRVQGAIGQDFSTAGLPDLRGAAGGGLPALTQGSPDARQRVEEALLARLEPQFARDREAVESRLLNAGIERGTEAFARESDRLDRAQTDARLQAVLAGGQEQSRLAGLESSIRGQLFGEGVTNTELDNSARAQGIQELAFLRSLPINEVNALRTGSQVNTPTFPGVTPTNLAPNDPIAIATLAANQRNAAASNQQSGFNSLLNAGALLGSAFV